MTAVSYSVISFFFRLARIQEDSFVKGIETGNYARNVPGPLKLGALQGNKFRIVIRDLQSAVDNRLLTAIIKLALVP